MQIKSFLFFLFVLALTSSAPAFMPCAQTTTNGKVTKVKYIGCEIIQIWVKDPALHERVMLVFHRQSICRDLQGNNIFCIGIKKGDTVIIDYLYGERMTEGAVSLAIIDPPTPGPGPDPY